MKNKKVMEGEYPSMKRDFMVSVNYKVEGTDFPINRDLDDEMRDFFKEEFGMTNTGSGSGFGVRDVDFQSTTQFDVSLNTPPPIDMDFINRSLFSMVEKYDVTIESINHWWSMTDDEYDVEFKEQQLRTETSV